jgi:hypothetical protein
MAEILNAVRGALTLNIPSLVRFRDRADVFRTGILILALVALVTGVVSFAVDFVGGLLASPETEFDRIQQEMEQRFQAMPPGASEQFQREFLRNFESGVDIGRRVAALPTRLPRPAAQFFQALAGWAGRPLGMLGGFMAYAIWVMLAAKLLGGTGRLQEFLGTAALSGLPYLLLILEKVPCLGSLLGFVAWIWSTLIWIAATAVVHGWATPASVPPGGTPEGVERYQVRWGKAILAVILPALALIVLGSLALIIMIVLIVVASN